MQSKFIVMNRLGSTSLGHLGMGDSSWACVVMDQAALGKLQLIAAQLARKLNLLEGYRTVVNSGAGAGQSVFHLHLHLLGGRSFRWPPG
jgi:hypothetical protein